MKKLYVSIVVAAGLVLTGMGCTKDKGCQEKTVASEEGVITAYANANGIAATRDPIGLYYQIMAPGNSTKPTISSVISVKYTGKRLDGTIFDQRTVPITFGLGGTIAGWQLGIPLIGEGGVIKLIVPSSLAYGCAGRAPIEPYSVLYFEVELVDVL